MTDLNSPPRLKANLRRVRALCHGRVVADTRHAITLFEPGREPVHYFPQDDVEIDLLVATGRSSRCPVKGVAEVYDLRVGERTAEDAAWIYTGPEPSVLALKSYVAFDGAKVDVRELAMGEALYPLPSASAEPGNLAMK